MATAGEIDSKNSATRTTRDRPGQGSGRRAACGTTGSASWHGGGAPPVSAEPKSPGLPVRSGAADIRTRRGSPGVPRRARRADRDHCGSTDTSDSEPPGARQRLAENE
jgi:hypothetical protein